MLRLIVFFSNCCLLIAAEAANRTCQEDRDSRISRIGGYRPQCEEDGIRYKVMQGHGSSGYRWCVDPKTGIEVQGTKVPPGPWTPHCRECEHKRNATLVKRMIGSFVPACTEDGFYTKIQQHGSSGYSWCVNQVTGEEKEDTRVGPGGGEITCREHTPQITEVRVNISPDKSKMWITYIEVMAAPNMQFVVYYIPESCTHLQCKPLKEFKAVFVQSQDTHRRITVRNFFPDDGNTYTLKVRPVSETGVFGDVSQPTEAVTLTENNIPPKIVIENVTRSTVFGNNALFVDWKWPSNWQRAWEFVLLDVRGTHSSVTPGLEANGTKTVASGNLGSRHMSDRLSDSAYTVWVRARNVVGEGPWSEPFHISAVE